MTQFRELLGCLNSNGSIQEIQSLTDKMSDEELLPIVRVGSEQFFKNSVYLYRFEKTFYQWVEAGTLGQDLDQIGALVRNDRWVRSLLGLMSKSDPKLYPALQIVAKELNPKNVTKALNALIAIVESPAFRSLQRQLLKSGDSPLSKSELASAVFSYIQTQRAPGRVDVDRRLLKALADGSLFQVLDDFSLSISPTGDLRDTVAKISALSNQVSARETQIFGFSRRDGELFRELMSLVNAMHAPISCLSGALTVPDGVLFVLGEVSNRSTKSSDRFLRRDNLLDLGLLNSFCSYPESLSKYYGALKTLASTDNLFTAVEFAKAFYRNSTPDLLIDILGGEGTGAGIHSSLMTPLEEMLPVFAEITSRGAMEDLFLLISSIRSQDREQWQQVFAFLSRERPELDGLSIYDVLYDTVARSDTNLIADLIDGFYGFMAQDGEVLVLR
ncbi:MAG: hypothetical protein KGQ59_06850 [Bdellovibrionales bacterium]|nr:hypothetical protein [Bdellovibrionales bacterium]